MQFTCCTHPAGSCLYSLTMNSPQIDDKIFLLRLAFKGLEDEELAEVAALTEFRTYPANHVLCQEGAY